MLFAAVIILARLWFLQVMARERFVGTAEAKTYKTVSIAAPRGRILDRDGDVLATGRASVALKAVPAIVLKDKAEMIMLSDLLKIPYAEIEQKLTSKLSDPLQGVVLKSDLDGELQARIGELKYELPGVSIEPEVYRYYPGGSVAAHVLGYVGPISEDELKKPKMRDVYAQGDIIGKSGIEMQYEDLLRGTPGHYVVEVNPSGFPVKVVSKEEPIRGDDVFLTLDEDIQLFVENLVAAKIDEIRTQLDEKTKLPFNASGAAAIVLDATNGEVLAMVSYPSYNPNLFSRGISVNDWETLNDPRNYFPLNNRALMSYPPASTFKPVVFLTALLDGVATPGSTFTCKGVWYGLGEKYPKYCWAAHGTVDMVKAIEQSCDIAFYQMALELYRHRGSSGEIIQRVAREFGFGKRTGIDLPYESDGRVPDARWKREYNRNNPQNAIWYAGDTVNLGIGQGDLLATPLQVASLFLTIANRGVSYAPHLFAFAKDSEGNIVKSYEMQRAEVREIKREWYELLIRGMVNACRDGTASAAFSGFPLDSYPVAGKTGTAEVLGKQNYSWFASFAPANEPRFVVVVMVEEGGSGGKAAAEIARKIYEHLFNLR